MNTEPLIDSDGQPTNPDDGPTNGGVSARKRTANRANSGKSTGPRSAMGKRIASQNSFKNGYYSNERRLQLMGELEEDPALRERRRQGLYESYPPGAPVEEMLLDDLTDHWYMRDRLVRLDASVKLRELQEANLDEWRREEQNESWAVDYVKSEISKGGLVRQKDCPGKFRLILDILGQLLPIAKSRSGGMDHQPLWKMLYGTNDANRRGEEMFLKFYQGPHMSDAEYVEVLGFLEDELDSYHRAWIRYKVEHQQETVASREARLVTCGGDALILFKEMEVTDRQIERKLQLLLKVRAERFAREKEESRAERRSAQDEPQPGTGASPDPNGETSPHHPEGGAAKIPPRKPVERGSRPSARQEERKAKGKGQKSKGRCEDRAARSNGTFDLQPSTFDFFKNEATDLPENKGSASAEIRNEATVEGSRQAAERTGQAAGLRYREAAERRHTVAQGEGPGVGGRHHSSLFPPSAEGGRRMAAAERRKSSSAKRCEEGGFSQSRRGARSRKSNFLVCFATAENRPLFLRFSSHLPRSWEKSFAPSLPVVSSTWKSGAISSG